MNGRELAVAAYLQEHVLPCLIGRDASRDEVFPHAYTFDSGYMDPGDEPGLGVTLDEELAARHPYQRDYLPVVRKLDGTLKDW